MFLNCLIDTGASCSIVKESVAKRLNCALVPCSRYASGIGNGKVHIYATITVPVRFEDICIELDIQVVRDDDLKYDLVIGRNALNHPDIELTVDSNSCTLTRKREVHRDILKINLIYDSLKDVLAELRCYIQHLDLNLKDKIISIFEKYPNVYLFYLFIY